MRTDTPYDLHIGLTPDQWLSLLRQGLEVLREQEDAEALFQQLHGLTTYRTDELIHNTWLVEAGLDSFIRQLPLDRQALMAARLLNHLAGQPPSALKKVFRHTHPSTDEQIADRLRPPETPATSPVALTASTPADLMDESWINEGGLESLIHALPLDRQALTAARILNHLTEPPALETFLNDLPLDRQARLAAHLINYLASEPNAALQAMFVHTDPGADEVLAELLRTQSPGSPETLVAALNIAAIAWNALDEGAQAAFVTTVNRQLSISATELAAGIGVADGIGAGVAVNTLLKTPASRQELLSRLVAHLGRKAVLIELLDLEN